MAMEAIVIDRFGGPDVLERRTVPRPEPGPGEVAVRVVVSGTNPVEAKIRQGVAIPDLKLPAILGSDVSGVVEAIGPGVSNLSVGDEVFYTPELTSPHGSYAQFTVAAADIVAPKPAALSHSEAAAVPLAGGTAWEAIVRRLRVLPGETVLIKAGAGGVGTFAIQIAKAAGATVLATAGPENQSLLAELGAVPIDYEHQDPVQVAMEHTDGAGVDAVLDLLGGVNIIASSAAARRWGRLATTLPPSGEIRDFYLRNQVLHGILLTRERQRLLELTPLLESGAVRPVIEEVLPLDQVREVHTRLESGHGRGKTVLTVSGDGA